MDALNGRASGKLGAMMSVAGVTFAMLVVLVLQRRCLGVRKQVRVIKKEAPGVDGFLVDDMRVPEDNKANLQDAALSADIQTLFGLLRLLEHLAGEIEGSSVTDNPRLSSNGHRPASRGSEQHLRGV